MLGQATQPESSCRAGHPNLYGMLRCSQEWPWNQRSQAGAQSTSEVQDSWACQLCDERPYAQHAIDEARACTVAIALGMVKTQLRTAQPIKQKLSM